MILKSFIPSKLSIFSRKFTFYMSIGFLILLLISFSRSVVRVRKVDDLIKQKQDEVDKLKAEQEELIQKVKEVDNATYLEKQLRDKLGLAKEGEIVIVLPDADFLRKLAPVDEIERETLPDPNWKKWAHLFDII